MISFERHADRGDEATVDYIYDVPGFDVARRTDRGTFDRAELAASSYFDSRRFNFYLANTYSMIWKTSQTPETSSRPHGAGRYLLR